MMRSGPGFTLLAVSLNAAVAQAQPAGEPPPAQPAEPQPPAPTPLVPSESSMPPVPDDAAAASEKPKPHELPCLNTPDGCRIEDFKTPTAPAFTIIGITPSQVESPRTPKELSVALYHAYNGGALAQNIALDVAPYWLWSHSDLTYDQYVNAGVFRQLMQNASLSIATAAVPEQDATDIGFGLRTHWFLPDGSDAKAGKAYEEAKAKLDALQNREQLQTIWDIKGCEFDRAQPACRKIGEKLQAMANLDGAFQESGKAVQDALLARSGFSVGLAGAVASRSAADEFRLNDFRKAAGWLNGGYRGKWMELMGLVRYTFVDAASSLGFVDLGGRVGVYNPKLGLYGEAIYRTLLGEAPPVPNSARLSGTFEFKVTDEVFVSATYGKEADNETKAGTSFALVGLNFQAGKRKLGGI